MFVSIYDETVQARADGRTVIRAEVGLSAQALRDRLGCRVWWDVEVQYSIYREIMKTIPRVKVSAEAATKLEVALRLVDWTPEKVAQAKAFGCNEADPPLEKLVDWNRYEMGHLAAFLKAPGA